MDHRIIDSVKALRVELHDLAERSGEETRTKAHLMAFLRAHTSLQLVDGGQWFYALHLEPGASETIAFRADMDAIPFEGGAAHLCGHDGHSAVLAGLGLFLEGKTLGRNIVLLFQHAEETGAGGAPCAQALWDLNASRVYAFHNIPGYALGTVLLRQGVFACASRGIALTFEGAPAHAAYPEDGRNPGFAAARLLSVLPSLTDPSRFTALTMATLVGATIGSDGYGSAAGTAQVRLTLRAIQDADMASLIHLLQSTAAAEATQDGVTVQTSFQDIFPATVNNTELLGRLTSVCEAQGLATENLPEPFRWSEDFAHYGNFLPAAMVGIGAGPHWPQLHTEGYDFNDAIIPTALTLFSSLAAFG